ncbi:MAG: S41 family peptidase [Bacteroidaceae bacterium]|nr:S41 family peptidase [Bacteroidaceae bacterium]
MKKILTLFIILALVQLTAVGQTMRERAELNMAAQKIGATLMAIKGLYIDTVNTVKLADEAIKGMLSQLDPHSSYSNAEETKRFTEPLNSNFEGIGVQFNVLNDTLVVIQPVSKGPSEKAGILAGDRIILVNDSVFAGVKLTREQMMKRLRGPKGSVVEVGVKRRGVEETLYFRLVRDKIPLHSLDAAYMIRPEVGLIRLENFAVSTKDELHEAIKKLKKQGMKSLILDLQTNGGGYLEAAYAVSSEFLDKGDLVVYTDGRSVPKQRHVATGKGSFEKGRLIVLVDEYTASSAEIVSGAVQDNDRGIIIGRRTFGKGLVQRPIELPDGSMVRLTVSHYYTPSGRCIQKPYVKGQKKDYDSDMLNRYNNGELMHQDSIHFADSLKCYTLKKHRVVYGGGGIMPDIFVPLDTTVYTKHYRALARKNIIINSYMEWYDKHRSELAAKFDGFDSFKQDFEIPRELVDTIMSRGGKADVHPANNVEQENTAKRLRIQLKALLARDLWDTNEYYAIMNEEDAAVRRALELLANEEEKE